MDSNSSDDEGHQKKRVRAKGKAAIKATPVAAGNESTPTTTTTTTTTTTNTTTTTGTASSKTISDETNSLFLEPFEKCMEFEQVLTKHSNEIRANSDYLPRLIRTQKNEDFENALKSWQRTGSPHALLTNDSSLNPLVLKNANQSLPNISLIQTAINVKNTIAAELILKHLISNGQSLSISLLNSIINGSEDEGLHGLVMAYSDAFELPSTVDNDKRITRTQPIKLAGLSHIDALVRECREIIANKGANFDTFIKESVTKYKFPFFNACGFVISGIEEVYYLVDDDSGDNTEQMELRFKYNNNPSLFKFALERGNLSALRILLDTVVESYPHGTGVCALYDIIAAEDRLVLFPQLIQYIVEKIIHNLDEKVQSKLPLIASQLLSNPMTKKSIFSMMLSRVGDFQALYDQASSSQTMSGDANQAKQLLRAPVARMFSELFQCGVLILNLVVQLYHIPFEATKNEFWNALIPVINQASGPNGPIYDPKKTALEGVDKQMNLFVQNFIQTVADLESAHRINKPQITSQYNCFEEFIISIFVHFIPYLKPSSLVLSFETLSPKYVELIKPCISKLPHYFLRPFDYNTPFVAHSASYTYRTTPRKQTESIQPPQLITATLLRAPIVSPTSTAQNWQLAPINDAQTARLKLFNSFGPEKQTQVHPISLLKLHPLAIFQMIYLYSQHLAPFQSSDMHKSLLEQLESTDFGSKETLQHSITTRADSPAFFNLMTTGTISPYLLPLIAPTVSDFVMYCQSKAKDSSDINEKSFYHQYVIETLQSLGYLPKLKIEDFIATFTEQTPAPTVDSLQKSSIDWVRTQGKAGKQVTRTSETQFMTKNQSESSLRRLADQTTVLRAVGDHRHAAQQGNILGLDDQLLVLKSKITGQRKKGEPIDLLAQTDAQLEALLQSIINGNLVDIEIKDCDNEQIQFEDGDEALQKILEQFEKQAKEIAADSAMR
jgi:hypothetical protein